MWALGIQTPPHAQKVTCAGLSTFLAEWFPLGSWGKVFLGRGWQPRSAGALSAPGRARGPPAQDTQPRSAGTQRCRADRVRVLNNQKSSERQLLPLPNADRNAQQQGWIFPFSMPAPVVASCGFHCAWLHLSPIAQAVPRLVPLGWKASRYLSPILSYLEQKNKHLCHLPSSTLAIQSCLSGLILCFEPVILTETRCLYVFYETKWCGSRLSYCICAA